MADNIGFLEKLGVSPVDEEAIARAKAAQAFERNTAYASAVSGSQKLAQGVGGLIGGLFNKDSGESFTERAKAKRNEIKDKFIAQANGISPEQLRARREIRKEAANVKYDPKETGLQSQIALARKVAMIALKAGDAETYGKAISSLSSLRKQQAEFNKLKATTASAEAEAEQSGLVDAYLNGEPVTGTFAKQRDPDTGKLKPGLVMASPNGTPFFKPFGEELSREDFSARRAKDAETLDQRIRRFIPKKELGEIKNLVVASAGAMRKFDRVMSTVTDLVKLGGAEEVMSTSGRFVAFIDNAARNIRGVAKSFIPLEAEAADNAGKYYVSADGKSARGVKSWMKQEIENPNSDLWNAFELPESVQKVAAAAQAYRANVLELAYMVARLSEPSNRGLSDRDVSTALERLTAGGSNPQVIMRRFAEMMGDSANELDTKLDTYHGSFGGATDAQIDQVLGGDALPKYREAKSNLEKKYGYTYDEAGRAVFIEPLDSDVQPGEGITNNAPPPIDIENMSDEEAAALLFGE